MSTVDTNNHAPVNSSNDANARGITGDSNNNNNNNFSGGGRGGGGGGGRGQRGSRGRGGGGDQGGAVDPVAVPQQQQAPPQPPQQQPQQLPPGRGTRGRGGGGGRGGNPQQNFQDPQPQAQQQQPQLPAAVAFAVPAPASSAAAANAPVAAAAAVAVAAQDAPHQQPQQLPRGRGGRGSGRGRVIHAWGDPDPANNSNDAMDAGRQQSGGAGGRFDNLQAQAPAPAQHGGGRGGGGGGGGGGYNNNSHHNQDDDDSQTYNRGAHRGGRGGQRGGGGGGGQRGGRGGGNRVDADGAIHSPSGQRPSRAKRSASEEKEVEELFVKRHQTGIAFDRYSDIPVEVSPKDIEGVKAFSELKLHPDLAANVRRCGYEIPTPVQKFGIPISFAGKDIMACAQTGSGKTAAFLLPIVNHCLVHGVSLVRGGMSMPIGVIMAPTRELALQIFDEARKVCFQTDVYPCVAYGGVDFQTQIMYMMAGCDIVVATPGRLKDMYDRHRIAFKRTKFLVLDEADRMLDLGFDEEIRYLIGNMPDSADRQTLLYSATFPRAVQMLARQYLKPDVYILKVGRVGSTTKNITQRVISTGDSHHDKTRALLRLLCASQQSDLVLVFVSTKDAADTLTQIICDEGIPCNAIHGGRKQWEREDALARFKTGEVPVLIATDVASRGLDIPNVAHVVQYDLPTGMDDYVHRIGRTGRAGNKGLATCFFADSNFALAPELHKYLQDHEQEVPEFLEAAATQKFGERRAAAAEGGGGRRGGGRGGGRGGRGRDDERPEEVGKGYRAAPAVKPSSGAQAVYDGGF